jgi:hypothetical protein
MSFESSSRIERATWYAGGSAISERDVTTSRILHDREAKLIMKKNRYLQTDPDVYMPQEYFSPEFGMDFFKVNHQVQMPEDYFAEEDDSTVEEVKVAEVKAEVCPSTTGTRPAEPPQDETWFDPQKFMRIAPPVLRDENLRIDS